MIDQFLACVAEGVAARNPAIGGKVSTPRWALERVKQLEKPGLGFRIYISLSFVAIVAGILAWRAGTYHKKTTDGTGEIDFARAPDLQLELLSTSTALELQIRNVETNRLGAWKLKAWLGKCIPLLRLSIKSIRSRKYRLSQRFCYTKVATVRLGPNRFGGFGACPTVNRYPDILLSHVRIAGIIVRGPLTGVLRDGSRRGLLPNSNIPRIHPASGNVWTFRGGVVGQHNRYGHRTIPSAKPGHQNRGPK